MSQTKTTPRPKAAPAMSKAAASIPAKPPKPKTAKPKPAEPVILPVRAAPAPASPAEPTSRKVSALDAAARVLDEAGTPLRVSALIGAMAAKGYWSSPGGKTPAATLSAALRREIATKGKDSRFRLDGKGLFARTQAATGASAKVGSPTTA